MKPAIPPALTAVLFGVAMWGVDQLYQPGWATFAIYSWIYRLLFGVGLSIIFLAVIQFASHGTTVDPHNLNKANALVRNGVYRFSRNPMYLAMLIWLAAFELKLGNVPVFLLLPIFVWYMNRFQIKQEEAMLQQKFGASYTEYKQRVRRWL